MQAIIAATLAGAGLGLALYGCVRLRMHVGPMLRERYGNWARQLYWVATIVVMIAIANFALLALRDYLGPGSASENHLLLEIWFICVAVLLAFGLIYRRMTSGR